MQEGSINLVAASWPIVDRASRRRHPERLRTLMGVPRQHYRRIHRAALTRGFVERRIFNIGNYSAHRCRSQGAVDQPQIQFIHLRWEGELCDW